MMKKILTFLFTISSIGSMYSAQEHNAKRHKALQEDQFAAANALLSLSNPAAPKQGNSLACTESSLSDSDDDCSDTHSDCPSPEQRIQAGKQEQCQWQSCGYKASALEVKNHTLYEHVQKTIEDMVRTGQPFPIECPYKLQKKCDLIKTKAGFRSHVLGKHLRPEFSCGTCGKALPFSGRSHYCIKKNKESK